MRLSQFCKNELQAQYSFTYQAQYISTEVVYIQRWHGWCRMKLLPSGTFCVHHTTMHHVTSCKAIYVRCMRV